MDQGYCLQVIRYSLDPQLFQTVIQILILRSRFKSQAVGSERKQKERERERHTHTHPHKWKRREKAIDASHGSRVGLLLTGH